MTGKIHNSTGMKENRKRLRKNLTPAEARLWTFLKGGQLFGRKFRRQHSIGPFVLDFYCPAEKLCIELDGAAHYMDGGYEYDEGRTEYLKAHNVKVLRFENKVVFENMEGLLEEIRRQIAESRPSVSGGVAGVNENAD